MRDSKIEPLTVEKAEKLNKLQRLEFLREAWDLRSLVVRGQIVRITNKLGEPFYALVKIMGPTGQSLAYPLSDLHRNPTVDFAYAGKQDFARFENAFVSAELWLSAPEKCKAEGNPFLLCVAPKSVNLLERIAKDDLVTEPDGTVLIEASVKAEFVRQHRDRYQAEVKEFEAEVTKIKAERQQLVDATESLRGEEAELLASVEKLTETEAEKKKLLDHLRSLDFITDQQHAYYQRPSSATPKTEPRYLDFHRDLGGDFAKLVGAIQAILYSKKHIYPRYLLTDFLTLLRTNDLIVLAGLSGSGKTQLVRSFAEAIGGEPHIIPVKPNWTSAEDLLGYFNPLQNSYWVTPFLKALIEASRDPDRLHLICLDEMNLAHVEYYFADFLSLMEERRPDKVPKLQLYSKHEENQLISEVRYLLKDALGESPGPEESSFDHLVDNEAFRQRLKKVWGDEKETAEYQGRLRRMVSGLLQVPAEFPLPTNVRILGSVNFDETTHSLAPKVLDRAHVLKFVSPLDYPVDGIRSEVAAAGNLAVQGDALPECVLVTADDLSSQRADYPEYDLNDDAGRDTTVAKLKAWREAYLAPLGRDIGLRTVRQATHYCNLYLEAVSEASRKKAQNIVLNNLLLHKILPRFSFDGNSPLEVVPKGTLAAEPTAGGDLGTSRLKKSLVEAFRAKIGADLADIAIEEFTVPQLEALTELDGLISRASGSDDIFNYWS